MMARILHSPSRVAALLLTGTLLFAACGQIDIGLPPPTVEKVAGQPATPTDLRGTIFPPGKPSEKPIPKPSHLAECNAASDCFGGTKCVNIFGTPLCFFGCDPKKGQGDKQNPNCIAPENCIELNDGSGVCVSMPGQLYGIGSYKAIVRHKQGDQCLLRYGGCDEGLLCVDTAKQGSIGTCQEFCNPAVDATSKVQPTCQTAGTTCQRLSSGFGACLK